MAEQEANLKAEAEEALLKAIKTMARNTEAQTAPSLLNAAADATKQLALAFAYLKSERS